MLSDNLNYGLSIIPASHKINFPYEKIFKDKIYKPQLVQKINFKEKKLIFKVHLSRLRPKSWSTYNIPLLSEMSKKFSGAEIEEVIIEAMHTAFSENREFTVNDILDSITQCV